MAKKIAKKVEHPHRKPDASIVIRVWKLADGRAGQNFETNGNFNLLLNGLVNYLEHKGNAILSRGALNAVKMPNLVVESEKMLSELANTYRKARLLTKVQYFLLAVQVSMLIYSIVTIIK